jgi:hypothetical protein
MRNDGMRTRPRNQSTRTSFDSFGELIGRALFIGIGLLILTQYGFRDVFTSVLGLTFALSPIVTVQAVKVRIESLLKITSNRVSHKVIGKEVFTVEQRDFKAQTVIGHLHGDLIQPGPEKQEKRDESRADDNDWRIARDFNLPGEGDAKEFRLKMSRGDHLTGYVSANDEVCAYVLTSNSRNSFKNGYGFSPLWDSEWETYAKVDFVALKTGTYYFVVTNEPDEDESDYYDDEDETDDVAVELRLKL